MSYKVMIVDDEAIVRESIARQIDWGRYQMELTGTAENAAEALAMLKEHPVDLMLVDIRLPMIDGLELVRQVRRLYPSIQFIMISGYADFEYAREAMRSHALDYLLKPLNPVSLLTAIRKAQDTWEQNQFAQSLYTLLWQCGRMDEIPDFVFSNADEVSVWYDEEEICTGQNEVRLFFRKMKEKTLNNGGFFRIDMPATQWIEVSDDGQSAAGHWLTMSRQIDRSESGNQYRVRIGLFSNTFRREGGVWKFVSVRWEKLQDFAPYDETPDMNLENYRKDPAGWLTDLPVLKPVSREEGDGRAEEILVLRNKILSWFHAVNTGKTAADVFPCGTEEVREDLQEMLRDVRYILATSPVFSMDEGLTKAEGFFSVSLLTDTEEDEMTNVRGSVGMTLTRTEYGWEIRRFSWYPYAALDSWKKDGEAALLA